MFWNCQSIGSKLKELELYLKENNFDVVALNETFFIKKVDFKIQGYDTIKIDRSTGTRGGVAFLVKHGLVINKEYRNIDFNIITDNEALVIGIDLCNNQNLILATIYCPNRNPNFRLFINYQQPFRQCHVCWRFQFEVESFRLCQEKQRWSNAQKHSKSSEPNLLKQ